MKEITRQEAIKWMEREINAYERAGQVSDDFAVRMTEVIMVLEKDGQLLKDAGRIATDNAVAALRRISMDEAIDIKQAAKARLEEMARMVREDGYEVCLHVISKLSPDNKSAMLYSAYLGIEESMSPAELGHLLAYLAVRADKNILSKRADLDRTKARCEIIDGFGQELAKAWTVGDKN